MALVFFSHSSKDKPFVQKLADELQKHGIQTWLDEAKIHVGDSIPQKIVEGISSCDYFCLIISKASASSKWVERECNSAAPRIVNGKAKHVPVLLEKVEMPSLMADIKYADFTGSFERGVRELLSAFDRSDLKTLTDAEMWARYGRLSPKEIMMRKRPLSPPRIEDYLRCSRPEKRAILEKNVLPHAYRSIFFVEHTDTLSEHLSFFERLLKLESDPDILKLAGLVYDKLYFAVLNITD
jgi:hypothetical protein